MKIVNHHSRIIEQPIDRITPLFETLATDKDLVWPTTFWPPMRFRGGIRIGAEGGHGSIRYSVSEFDPGRKVVFVFREPKGFMGTHTLQVLEQGQEVTKIDHEIRMTTSGLNTFYWLAIIRPLHDALIEDAFDNVAGKFASPRSSSWSPWVRFLRHLFKFLLKNKDNEA